ncbi:MAG: aldose 1-epimerase family protein [Dehalococcoidia bacterium]
MVVQTGSILPSGEQFELRLGDQRAVVTEVGATLRSYTVAGREFLDTFAEGQMSPAGHGQVLVPWPNRIDGGRYTFQGHSEQVPLNEPEKQNAIHGLVRWLNWAPIARDAARIALGLLLHPQPGYPFLLALEQEYALTDAGLTVRISARNTGSTPLPFGAGQHPYFTIGTPRVDETRLRVPARTSLTTNDRGIPTGRAPVAGTNLDFREERLIGPLQLDTCFTDLEPDGDGRTRVSLCHPSGAPRLTVTLDAAHPFAQIYTGDTIADPEARRRGVAIEAMTCPANAFNSGDGLRTLQPGESFSASWSVSAS